MKVFVTGIAGFLGSYIAEEFLKQGHEVAGNDNLIGGSLDNVPEGAKFYETDCCDLAGMVKAMTGADVVYHTAATPHEGLSVFSPHFVTRNVFDATASVLSAAVQVGAKRFIHMSSMSRYGSQEVPFVEDMTPRPQDPYAIAKAASESLVREVCETHGLEWVVAIPHNIIGPRQKYDDPFRNVASIMINRVLQGKPPIVYGDGTQMRCFSYIEDDLFVLTRLATADCSGETFNIGPDEEFVTINELASLILELTGSDLQPEYYPDRPREVKKANCSADKIREWFGYETKWSLRDGLAEMIQYIQEKGPKEFEYHIPLEIVNETTPKTWSERKM